MKTQNSAPAAPSPLTYTRVNLVYLILAGAFVCNAILGEVMGGKLIQAGPWNVGGTQIGPVAMSIGVIPWPVVFLTTDLINEYFGRAGVRRLTLLTAALIIYAFVLIYIAMGIPAAPFSPVNDQVFATVFGQSLWIIVGSLVAFCASQLVDVFVFWLFRDKTQGKMLWLRATGSTVVSQFIDSVTIVGIAFLLPGKITLGQFANVAASNYSYKLLIALAMTPILYAAHGMIDRFIGHEQAHRLVEEAARKSEGSKAPALEAA